MNLFNKKNSNEEGDIGEGIKRLIWLYKKPNLKILKEKKEKIEGIVNDAAMGMKLLSRAFKNHGKEDYKALKKMHPTYEEFMKRVNEELEAKQKSLDEADVFRQEFRPYRETYEGYLNLANQSIEDLEERIKDLPIELSTAELESVRNELVEGGTFRSLEDYFQGCEERIKTGVMSKVGKRYPECMDLLSTTEKSVNIPSLINSLSRRIFTNEASPKRLGRDLNDMGVALAAEKKRLEEYESKKDALLGIWEDEDFKNYLHVKEELHSMKVGVIRELLDSVRKVESSVDLSGKGGMWSRREGYTEKYGDSPVFIGIAGAIKMNEEFSPAYAQ